MKPPPALLAHPATARPCLALLAVTFIALRKTDRLIPPFWAEDGGRSFSEAERYSGRGPLLHLHAG